MRTGMHVLKPVEVRLRSPLWSAYEHFRLERQGSLCSPNTLHWYDWLLTPFFEWVDREHPEVRSFAELDVSMVRTYRAEYATAPTKHGRQRSPESVRSTHKALMAFLRWAEGEGHQVDPRIFRLARPRVPEMEATVFHFTELKRILDACNPEVPQEELIVRILVGSGLRASELCGLALKAPDGLPDVMLDSMVSGRVELRVRWDAGAKGKKSRRVPITPKLAAAIKRYESRHRHDSPTGLLLINERRQPYDRHGIDMACTRLSRRVGFRVHPHAFRHTFATVATKMGWNFEHLRAAMGHSDYKILQRYVRLATIRDLGRRKDWEDFIAASPATDWT